MLIKPVLEEVSDCFVFDRVGAKSSQNLPGLGETDIGISTNGRIRYNLVP
jgi:hypothetical protein